VQIKKWGKVKIGTDGQTDRIAMAKTRWKQ